MYDSMMSKEFDMNVENEENGGVKVEHVDCLGPLILLKYLCNLLLLYSNYIT